MWPGIWPWAHRRSRHPLSSVMSVIWLAHHAAWISRPSHRRIRPGHLRDHRVIELDGGGKPVTSAACRPDRARGTSRRPAEGHGVRVLHQIPTCTPPDRTPPAGSRPSAPAADDRGRRRRRGHRTTKSDGLDGQPRNAAVEDLRVVRLQSRPVAKNCPCRSSTTGSAAAADAARRPGFREGGEPSRDCVPGAQVAVKVVGRLLPRRLRHQRRVLSRQSAHNVVSDNVRASCRPFAAQPAFLVEESHDRSFLERRNCWCSRRRTSTTNRKKRSPMKSSGAGGGIQEDVVAALIDGGPPDSRRRRPAARGAVLPDQPPHQAAGLTFAAPAAPVPPSGSSTSATPGSAVLLRPGVPACRASSDRTHPGRATRRQPSGV